MKIPSYQIEIILSILSTVFFGLQYVEILIKRGYRKSLLQHLRQIILRSENYRKYNLTDNIESIRIVATRKPVSDKILTSMAWFGKQGLDEFRLTYLPKDNAYYSRLLELQA